MSGDPIVDECIGDLSLNEKASLRPPCDRTFGAGIGFDWSRRNRDARRGGQSRDPFAAYEFHKIAPV
jgi:hypothetical protein